jgi:sugar O-acyltransferase (sialic acid O-acetyltransferase NeuD family)
VNSCILYGASSSVIVDIEETCFRKQIDIIAIVKNHDAKSYASQTQKLIDLSQYHSALIQHPITIPLFTPGHRHFAYQQALQLGASRFIALIDPTAIMPAHISIGLGVYINAGVVIGSQTVLDDFVFINRAATLGHHAVFAKFVSIGPGAVIGGHVNIGQGAVIGLGAIILPEITIGSNAIIAAGAVVTKDVPAQVMVAGNPAKIIKHDVVGYHGVAV